MIVFDNVGKIYTYNFFNSYDLKLINLSLLILGILFHMINKLNIQIYKNS